MDTVPLVKEKAYAFQHFHALTASGLQAHYWGLKAELVDTKSKDTATNKKWMLPLLLVSTLVGSTNVFGRVMSHVSDTIAQEAENAWKN